MPQLFFYFILFFNFTILYWFCHISTWICHRYTRVPHPEPSSLFPPYTIPLGHPSAPAPSIQCCASHLDWRLVSYMILYMFQCHSPKSSHPLPLPQSPIHQCLFCYLVYRVIVTVFLNSKMSISRWIDKKAVVHIHNGVLLSHEKEYIWISSNEVDETGAYYTEWSKPKRKTPIQYA